VAAPLDPPDSVLIARAQAGDTDAFGQLAERYSSLCYGTAAWILQDRAQAEDATQDALLRAYLGIGGFRGGSLRSWLLRITTRAAHNIRRSGTRRERDRLSGKVTRRPRTERLPHPEDPDFDRHDVPDRQTAANPVRMSELAEWYRRLDAALSLLPAPCRAVWVLYLEGATDREIAEVTCLPHGTVKSHIRRGRPHLATMLAPYRELLYP
jgi:RNA polymerase sigma-70 factor (ECF subfamily)